MKALAALVLAGVLAGPRSPGADDPRPIPPDQFDSLLRKVRPQPGEQRFWQIPWTLTITAAREQAAREGKPIFVWAGAGGAPIGVC